VISNADLLADLRRVGRLLNHDNTVTKRVYQREGKYAAVTFQKRFGSWRSALNAAGFETGSTDKISDDLLFDNLRECWMRLGRQPRKRETMPPASQFTHNPYVRRFGSWLNAMKSFCEIVDGSKSNATETPKEAARRGPKDPSLRLRFRVMRRDHFRCVICGRSPATDPSVLLHIDHIIAWSRGGVTEDSNLRTLCSHCNLGKSNLHPIKISECD
jgi:Homing endonuclease associated repeat/HNH endonuclease